MEKVSIIVPVYNAESSIGYCLNSITSQTYTNLEIILVNDGSKDNSLQICKNYAAIDNRIIVVNQKNGGVSHARNTGLSYATGTYVEFVDSDDCIALNMVEKLVESIEMYATDLAICGFKIVELTEKLPTNILHCTCSGLGKTCVLSQKNFFEHYAEILWKTATLEMPSNKLYKNSILKQQKLIFEEDCSLGEDFMLNMHYFEHMKNGVVMLSEEYYYYLQTNTESLTHKYRADLFDNELLLFNGIKNLLNSNVNLTIEEEVYMYEYMLSKVIFCMESIVSAKDILTEIQMKQQLEKIINNEDVRKAIKNSNYIAPGFEWLRDVYIFSDIDTLYEKVNECVFYGNDNEINKRIEDDAIDLNNREGTEKIIQRNPGTVNKILVKILNAILKVRDNKKIRLFKDTVYNQGIKIAIKKTAKVLKRHFFH